MTTRIFLIALLTTLSAFGAPAQKTKAAQTSGVFTDMFISRESGDIGGLELFFFLADKDYVLILKAEGELQPPQLQPVGITGNSVQFAMKTTGGALQFNGIFSQANLTGKFSDGTPLKLARKKALMMTTYSNLSFSKETGDATGMEITSFLADTHYVLFREGAGDLLPPKLVKAESQGGNLKFSLPGPNGTLRTFKGRESKTLLSGAFSDGTGSVKLPAK